MKPKIRVLIVDDSALIRLLLTEIFSQDDEFEVVGAAVDPFDAREKIKKTNPDVLTLDVEMPKMDGITFLKNLMKLRPMPVVMVSTLTEAGAEVTLQALELGAFDYVCKPSTNIKNNLTNYAEEIRAKTKAAARSKVINHQVSAAPTQKTGSHNGQFDLVAIGASTGGTEAIKAVLSQLPDTLPPLVMAQHIPDVFSTSFARRLNSISAIQVDEVRGPMELKAGHAYLAPGDDHMYVFKRAGKLMVDIKKTELVNRHRPSVDVLFDSVADHCGRRSIAAILTGMGNDGAQGLKNIRTKGGVTVAQDEASSVVWGMPGAAVELDAAMKVLSLGKVAEFITRAVFAR